MPLPTFPHFTHLICIFYIDSYMYRSHMLRDRTSISQTLYRGSIQPRNWHDHAVVNILWMNWNVTNLFALEPLIVMANSQKHQHKQRDQNNNYPGSFQKFCCGDDQCNDQCGKCSQAVDDHTTPPSFMFPSKAPPVKYHASLRERKRQKHTYGIKVNELSGSTVEHNQQKDGKQG